MAEHLELFPLFPGGENQRMPVGVIGQYKIENVVCNRLFGRLGDCATIGFSQTDFHSPDGGFDVRTGQVTAKEGMMW